MLNLYIKGIATCILFTRNESPIRVPLVELKSETDTTIFPPSRFQFISTFFPRVFPQWCGNVPVSQEYSRSFRRQAATNNRWVWDKEAQCVGLDREALGFFSPYQMCFRHSFVYSCFWVGKRRHLLNLLIRLKYFKSLYTLHTTHRILGAPNFYYNWNLVLVNPTGSWHCQFLPVLKGWKILINSHVPGSDNTEICVKFS